MTRPPELKKMIADGTALEVRAYATTARQEPLTMALKAIAGVTKVDTMDADGELLTYHIQAHSADTLIGPVAQAVLSAGAEVRDLGVKRPEP